MSGMRKQISFDLDTKALEIDLNWSNKHPWWACREESMAEFVYAGLPRG